MSNPNLDPTGEHFDGEDRQIEKSLRPKALEDFSGQPKIVENLKVFIAAAKGRGEALDHVLLHGPPGLGKTTLSYIIANELATHMKMSSGPVLEKPGDLATNSKLSSPLSLRSVRHSMVNFILVMVH